MGERAARAQAERVLRACCRGGRVNRWVNRWVNRCSHSLQSGRASCSGRRSPGECLCHEMSLQAVDICSACKYLADFSHQYLSVDVGFMGIKR